MKIMINIIVKIPNKIYVVLIVVQKMYVFYNMIVL